MRIINFTDRAQAGKLLAEKLAPYKDKDVIVYALPRGVVVTAFELAKFLDAPLDLIITRKIGHPHSPEYAVGAIAENGHSVFNKEEIVSIDKDYIKNESEKQQDEAKRRREVYLKGSPPVSCKGKTAIVVDDGIATGLTMKAAVAELKIHYAPKELVVAVPVVPTGTVLELENMGAHVVAVKEEKTFLGAIGSYYQDFSPVEDREVIRILKEHEEWNARKVNRNIFVVKGGSGDVFDYDEP